jgi:hypothetical protein
MRRHLQYLKYVLRHKWFVLIAAVKVGCPLWRAIIHDWHKFMPGEWFPYARAFYDRYGNKWYKPDTDFDHAWNAHQKRGKHHWQYWLLTFDQGGVESLDMPAVYIREMMADWWGAGKGQTGNWDAVTWYEKNKSLIKLSDATREILERELRASERKFVTPKDVEKRRAILGW